MRTFARAGGFRYRQSMILDANRCLVLERERRSLDWRQRMRAKEVTHELRMVRAIHDAGVPCTLHFLSRDLQSWAKIACQTFRMILQNLQTLLQGVLQIL